MHEIATKIDIQATAARVWEVLVDFSGYGKWNPLIASVDGTLVEGARLRAELRPEAIRHSSRGLGLALKTFAFRAWCRLCAMSIPIRVIKLAPQRELRWVGTLPVPGMFQGEHFFLIAERADGTVHFVQGERYTGLLEPMFREVIELINRKSYDAVNLALKRRVEARTDCGRSGADRLMG